MSDTNQHWQPVDAHDLVGTIADKTVLYDDGNWQHFAADGTTRYVDRGYDTFGEWRVRDGVFESVWPPSSRWDGYRVDITANGDAIRFVSPGGAVFGGLFGAPPSA